MIQCIILYSFCDGVQSPELNEVQYVGDIGYYVKRFFMGLNEIYGLMCQQH